MGRILAVRELSAHPHKFFGLLTRRSAWQIAKGLLERLGIAPAASQFRHV